MSYIRTLHVLYHLIYMSSYVNALQKSGEFFSVGQIHSEYQIYSVISPLLSKIRAILNHVPKSKARFDLPYLILEWICETSSSTRWSAPHLKCDYAFERFIIFFAEVIK